MCDYGNTTETEQDFLSPEESVIAGIAFYTTQCSDSINKLPYTHLACVMRVVHVAIKFCLCPV